MRITRSVQEHLGRQLRSTYVELQDKPVYLGDMALPPVLDQHVHRLELVYSNSARAQRCGLAAVATALSTFDRWH